MGSDKDMNFWEHVDALRGALWRVLALVAICVVAAAVAMPYLFDTVVLAPMFSQFATWRALGLGGVDLHLVNIELSAQMLVMLSTSVWMGLGVALPGVVYMLWRFFEPALYSRERRFVRIGLLFGGLMFYVGMVFGYFVVFPMSLRFLVDYQVSAYVPNQITLTSYIDAFGMLVMCMGVLFELPVVAWVLGRVGVLKREFFTDKRRHAVVAILVLSAIITPTTDPFTLFAVAVPVFLLWECAAVLVPAAGCEEWV